MPPFSAEEDAVALMALQFQTKEDREQLALSAEQKSVKV
jgi:hypothetical protein